MNYKELKQICRFNDSKLIDLQKLGFNFYAHGIKLESPLCLHCGKELEIRSLKSIDLDSQIVHVKMHGCKTIGARIDLNRFKSVFSDEEAEKHYSEYISRKTRKWQPDNPDSSSLNYHINRYGEQEGNKIYEDKKLKTNTRCVDYYLRKGMTLIEAKDALANAQSTFSLDKLIEKHGEDEGYKIWKDRQNRWQHTLSDKSLEDKLRINAAKGLSKEKFIEKHGLDRWKSKLDSMINSMKDRGWIIKNKAHHNDYYAIVNEITKISKKFLSNRPKGFHLDHKYSIAMGFRTRILPQIIGCPVNLEWLDPIKNREKSYNCSISKEQLLTSYEKWIKTENGKRYLQDISSLQSYLNSERDTIPS
jgi:hypothetical protein